MEPLQCIDPQLLAYLNYPAKAPPQSKNVTESAQADATAKSVVGFETALWVSINQPEQYKTDIFQHGVLIFIDLNLAKRWQYNKTSV